MIRAVLRIRWSGCRHVLVLAAWLGCAPVEAQTFFNATAAAGITHNTTPPICPSCAPTFAQEQSGGAAAGDFDGDGWPDLYVTRYFDSDVLYRNNRDGTFTDVTAWAFPGGIGHYQTNGAAWGDIDNDGDLDLAVATLNETRHLLYVNDGAGQFTEQGAARGVTIVGGLPTTAGTSFAMGDYDRDGYLDMYVAEWRGFSTTSSPAQARLFRNLGAAAPGHFVDVTLAAGVGMDITSGLHAGKGLSFTPRFADFDRDGRTDLAVVADGGATRLFWNNGDGTFSDGTAAAGVATGTNDMGFTLADVNGDGLLDWFVTSIGTGSGVHPSGNRLFINNGNRTFRDDTSAQLREGGWGWGAEALDFDNDGDLDIAHTNGMGVWATDQTMFFKNVGNRTLPVFQNVNTAVGVTDTGFGRGLLTFDYDRDGDEDMFLVNFSSPPILYRNDGGNAKNWLQIRTVGSSSNRDGFGAYLKVTPSLANPGAFYATEIDGGGTYLAQSDAVAHFGLGNATTIDRIEVVWPSGYSQTFLGVAVNQRVTIIEGLVGDFDRDDAVGWADLQSWRLHAGSMASDPAWGDADRDGDVDGRDFLIWQREVGRSVVSGLTASPSRSVPEPPGGAEAGLAALGAAGIAIRRAGRRFPGGRGAFTRPA